MTDITVAFIVGWVSGIGFTLTVIALIERSRRRHQPPKGLSTSFDAGPSIYIGEPSNKDTPAVGEIWESYSDDPFHTQILWKIVGVKGGYVQYADPIRPDGIRWSNTIKGFKSVNRRRQQPSEEVGQ